jgi:hypothetical protein
VGTGGAAVFDLAKHGAAMVADPADRQAILRGKSVRAMMWRHEQGASH